MKEELKKILQHVEAQRPLQFREGVRALLSKKMAEAFSKRKIEVAKTHLNNESVRPLNETVTFVIDRLREMVSSGCPVHSVQFLNGDRIDVDLQTAQMLVCLYDDLKPETQLKMAIHLCQSKAHFALVVNFGWSNKS